MQKIFWQAARAEPVFGTSAQLRSLDASTTSVFFVVLLRTISYSLFFCSTAIKGTSASSVHFCLFFSKWRLGGELLIELAF